VKTSPNVNTSRAGAQRSLNAFMTPSETAESGSVGTLRYSWGLFFRGTSTLLLLLYVVVPTSRKMANTLKLMLN
jgi:hypothetical protein